MPSDSEVTAEEWDILTADPLLELRLLALSGDTSAASGSVLVAVDPPDVVLHDRLSSISVPRSVLDAAGVDASTLTAAAAAVAAAPEMSDAAGKVGDPDDAGLLRTTARSVVATVLQGCLRQAVPGLNACQDGDARDALLVAILDALSPIDTKGLGQDVAGKVLRPLAERLATRAVVRRRGELMDPTTDFLRDIAFYLRRGEEVRAFIATEVGNLPPPVVIVGHSLGGIASVELMSAGERPQTVQLLVTIGSQAPYLYLMDALDVLRPHGRVTPYSPWLNIYSRTDLLSFYASAVFPNVSNVVDEEIDAGVPFPAAHSAYFQQERLYELLAEHWPMSS